MSRISPEDLAIALAVQDEQRRLGVRVQSVEEIAGLADPPARRVQVSKPFRPGRQVVSKGAVVPIVPGTEPTIATTMHANYITSGDMMPVIEAAPGLTGAQRGLLYRVMTALGTELQVDTCRVRISSRELATKLDMSPSMIHGALAQLEDLRLIHRPRGEGGRATAGIFVNPRYVARCRAARHADVMAEYRAAGGRQAGET